MNLTKDQMDALNHCIKCSICVDNCPVARVNPEFPGPKQLGVDWLRIAQEENHQQSRGVDYCSNCKTCEVVCPSGVRVGTLNQLLKSSTNDTPSGRSRLREIVFSDPSRLGRLIHIWPRAGNFFMDLSLVRILMEKIIKISAKAPMPSYSLNSLQKTFHKKQQEDTKQTKEIIYFPGCFVQYNKPEIGVSLIKTVERLGYRVIIPDFKCCGQPSISNARLQDTRKLAKHNLKVLQQHYRRGMKILFTCPSCMLTFKEEYQKVLQMDDFREFSQMMQDAGQFLLSHEKDLRKIVQLQRKEQTNLSISYHEPCHLKALGQGTPGLSLLRNVTGLKITSLEAGCCGIAGSYGLKAEKQWISKEIGKNIQEAAFNLKAETVITECGMCSVQINHITQLPVYHPIEILADFME